jgi:flagellar basal body-associated protein FliL
MIEILIISAAIAMLVVMGAIVFILARELSKQQPQQRKHATRTVAAPSSPPTELQRQLIRLCGGDRSTAERLAALEGGNWQTAIDRLIRDRR